MKTQVLLHHLRYLATVYKRQGFRNFLKHQLARSWGFHYEAWWQTYQTPCKQRSEWTLSHCMAAKTYQKLQCFLFKLKNWHASDLLTANYLFNLYFITKHKSTLLTSFQFVSSATFSFVSKLAIFWHSQAHIFPDKRHTQWLKKCLKTLCKKGDACCISLVLNQKKFTCVSNIFKKLGGLVGPSESNKDGHNWCLLPYFLFLDFYF